MIQGIYTVKFQSNQHDSGSGIVVFKDGTINGRDHGYVYTGKLIGEENNLHTELTIQQWNKSVPSVFGELSEFTLELDMKKNQTNDFIARGHVRSMLDAEIIIHGKYLSAAS